MAVSILKLSPDVFPGLEFPRQPTILVAPAESRATYPVTLLCVCLLACEQKYQKCPTGGSSVHKS